MNIKKTILILTSIFSTTSVMATNIDELKLFAQDYKPYSYLNEKGEKEGLTIEVMDALLKKMGANISAQSAKLKPFSRSFIRKNNDANAVFFPLAHLPEREKYFKWIGPIALDNPVIYANKNKMIKISSEGDLKKYKFAGKENYPGMTQLKELNVKSSNILKKDNDKEAFQELVKGETDLVVCSHISCLAALKDNGLNAKDYEIVYKLETFDLSIAFNKNTDEKIIAKMKNALEEFKKTKEYNIIVNKYTDLK